MYRADEIAMAVLTTPADGVMILEQKNERITFAPDEPVAGLIFYPGGKVQYESYAPLMEACAEKGILCVLLHIYRETEQIIRLDKTRTICYTT